MYQCRTVLPYTSCACVIKLTDPVIDTYRELILGKSSLTRYLSLIPVRYGPSIVFQNATLHLTQRGSDLSDFRPQPVICSRWETSRARRTVWFCHDDSSNAGPTVIARILTVNTPLGNSIVCGSDTVLGASEVPYWWVPWNTVPHWRCTLELTIWGRAVSIEGHHRGILLRCMRNLWFH